MFTGDDVLLVQLYQRLEQLGLPVALPALIRFQMRQLVRSEIAAFEQHFLPRWREDDVPSRSKPGNSRRCSTHRYADFAAAPQNALSGVIICSRYAWDFASVSFTTFAVGSLCEPLVVRWKVHFRQVPPRIEVPARRQPSPGDRDYGL